MAPAAPRLRAALLAAGAAAASALASWAAEPLEFLRAEGEVVTASRRPLPPSRAPSTVHVLSGEELRASGALTLWEALRGLPGVDVLASRAFHGEVSLRGLDKPLSNRTLVLLDGRTVLNGYFGFVVWEEIPVTLEEVERVEVVVGPASALYGADALTGVIHIITKSPDRLRNASARYTVGERGTHLGSVLHGGRRGDWAYKLAGGWRETGRFEDAARPSSRAGSARGFLSRRLSPEAEWSAEAGWARVETQVATGNNGTATAAGPVSFLRTDLRTGPARARLFWNRGRTRAEDFAALGGPALDYDSYDASAERDLALAEGHDLVVGAGYRKNTLRSGIFPPGLIEQDLWAAFFEHRWQAAERLDLFLSGRLDRHPHTPFMVSPRASAVYALAEGQTLRASAGTAFRYPTLLENYLDFTRTDPNPGGSLPNPPFSAVSTRLQGNRGLGAERIASYELAHVGVSGPLRTTLAAFHYRLTDVIRAAPAELSCGAPCAPTARLTASFMNAGETRAWGGEAGAALRLRRGMVLTGSYSLQNLKDYGGAFNAGSAPRHKLNGGVRFGGGGWSLGLSAHWVDQTRWNAAPPGSAVSEARLPDYTLVNLRLAREFGGAWEGLELAVQGYNVADRRHFQLLPAGSPALPGQYGEVQRARWTASASFRF